MYLAIDLKVSHHEDERELHEGHTDDWCCRPDDWYELHGATARLNERYGHDFADLGFEPKVGDWVHVVVEDYADGDTFGRTNHIFETRHVAQTRDDADAWISAQSESDHGYFGSHNAWHVIEALVRSGQ